MRIKVAKWDGAAQAEGRPEDVLELLGVLLRKGIDRMTLCTTQENASLCWGLLGEED